MTTLLRKIHLDFHTAGDVPRVGEAFDPETFADTLANAHVNALATPGKCQFGYTYFDTQLGTPHPGLVCPDLFPATVRACAARGIAVQAYFTLGLDDVVAERHPEWRQRYADGSHAQWSAKHLCFASPYIDDVVIPEAREMLARCPELCGFWFDICLYCDGAFYSPDFDRVARERLGMLADDRHQRWLLGRQLIREGCARLNAAIVAQLPTAENYFNSLVVPGEAANIPLQPVQEVENPVLFGGPEVMTTQVRWLRSHRASTIGLVSRFQGPWMDPGTLRTPDQLRFDVGRAVALGCHVSMGDHRHPDGTLDREVYRRIGEVYATVEACEPWLADATPCREAILLTEVERGTPHILPTFPATTVHAARLLEELGVQFDVVTIEEALPEAPLVIWPGAHPATPALRARLERHLARGGALLAMDAALEGMEARFGVQAELWTPVVQSDDAHMRVDRTAPNGHRVAGTPSPEASGPAGEFFRLTPALEADAFPHVITAPSRRLMADAAVEVLAERYAAWCGTPPCPDRRPLGPAIVQRGRAIYSAVPLVAEHQASGTPYPAAVLGRLIDRLLGEERLLRHDAGATVAAHLHRLPQGYALHLLHWALDRWGTKPNPAPGFPPLGPITVTARIPEPVQAITLEPAGTPLPFTQADGVCTVTLPGMRVWQVVGIRLGSRSS